MKNDTITSLPCPAYGYPHVKRVWFKGGQLIDVNQSRIKVSSNGSLLIGQLEVADEGQYTCNFSNTVRGRNSTASVTINLTGESCVS